MVTRTATHRIPHRIVRTATVALSFALATMGAVALPSVGIAQRGGSTAAQRKTARAADGRAARGAAPKANSPAATQQALIREVRQRFDAVVRKQLNLNDDQGRRLTAVEARLQPQRNQIQRDERQARLGLRTALQDSSGNVDQASVAQYMSQLVDAQHRRADLLDSEQKELSAFLTPVQRAKYQGLHDQLNKKVQKMRKSAGLPQPQPQPQPQE